MPRIQFNLDAATVNAFCDERGYQAVIPDPSPDALPGATIPNPQSKMAFIGQTMQNFLQEQAWSGKLKARRAARNAEDAADRATIVVPTGVIT